MNLPRAALALLTVALVGTASATSSYGAFFALTGSDDSALEAGSIVLSDNDAGGAVIALTDGDGGQTVSGCIEVRHDGTLDAAVRIYGTASGAAAPYLTLSIVRGTDAAPAFQSCAAFTPDPVDYIGAGNGVIWVGAMSTLPTTWDTGIVDPVPSGLETWSEGEAHSYRIDVTVDSNPAGQGLAGSLDLTFEGRNL